MDALPQQGEPFTEATAEAVQTSAMAVRLILAIADAVRRAAQRKTGSERPYPPADQATAEAAGDLKALVPADIATALMAGADSPELAQQLVALRLAGVDLQDFLPRVGEVAVAVRDAIRASTPHIAQDGTGEWARLLRETMPAGPVREAVLSSPTWPRIALAMKDLDERGADVREILLAAHEEGVGVDRAVVGAVEAGKRPCTALSPDAARSYGPLTAGLDVPKDLDLSDRARALAQLGVSMTENQRFVRLVQAALLGRQHEAALLAASRQWPLLALRMARMEGDGIPVADRLARLMRDRAWEQAPASQIGARLVRATANALTLPDTGEAAPTAVITTAARATSTTPGPPKGRDSGSLAGAARTSVPAARRLSTPEARRSRTR
ncbi:hypothetical protein ACFVFS_08485 [Kitasatospora sp. NPDC057692]|uniref:hypothetical protein n=1 Tax=Kitasatospora sp. NPDC057692 TaxID=3346215 RepID=UPI00368A9814